MIAELEIKRNKLDTLNNELATINNSMFHANHQKRVSENELITTQKELQEKEEKLITLRSDYERIANSEFVSNIELPEETKCPECGYLLNSDVFESIREMNRKNKIKFTNDKDRKLVEIGDEGKQLKLEVENLKLKVVDLTSSVEKNSKNYDDYNSMLEKKSKEKSPLEEEIKNLSSKMEIEFESEDTRKLKSNVDMLCSKIATEKSMDTTTQEIDDRIIKANESKIPYVDIISKHEMFKQTQLEIKRIEDEAEDIAEKQTSHEQQLAIVGDFMKTKLDMISENVESVFGTRVKFTLVRANIKEGSWEEVCFPSVIDKETPFIRGSESERIRTGIYMIECIKKKLNIPDVPIIFDRSNDLDSNNLSNLETNAQIITTRVDDVNFKEVTLTHK